MQNTPSRRLTVLLAMVALALASCGDGDDSGGATDATSAGSDPDTPAVVASSSEIDPESLAELVAISPLIVTGEVQSVERGRVIPSEGSAGDGEESAMVTIAVGEVLAGADPGPTIVVEEEGWLADGRRIALDGAPPTEVGDGGVWFLLDPADPEVDAWVSVGRVGRWIERDGVLTGPVLDIPIAIDLQDRPLSDVVADIAAATASSTVTTP